MIYVYELRVGERVIDVGVTSRTIETRLYEHTRNLGRWPNRTDITIHSVSEWLTLKLAMKEEGRLKLSYGLEWTERNNQIKGGMVAGPKRRVLKRKDILEIRNLSDLGVYQRDIANQYNVCQRTINKIVNKISYAEIV
tara:strand:+ start:21 stop:434 length:414 start_codon:yes stop_codon:yes gene_type:complete